MSIAAYPSDPVTELHAKHDDWLRKKSRDHDRAADLAHDTCVRILPSNIPTAFDQPRAYPTTVAKGLLIDGYQRQAPERAYLDALAYANRVRSTPTTPTHASHPATRWSMALYGGAGFGEFLGKLVNRDYYRYALSGGAFPG